MILKSIGLARIAELASKFQVRAANPHIGPLMLSSFGSATPSRFERRLPGGQHDPLFRVVFGSDAAASRFFRVSKMTVWRWRHDRAPLPEWVVRILSELVQRKVAEAHEAQNALRYFLALPRKPPPPLSGCCAGYVRTR
jgi:hypothetical protein